MQITKDTIKEIVTRADQEARFMNNCNKIGQWILYCMISFVAIAVAMGLTAILIAMFKAWF